MARDDLRVGPGVADHLPRPSIRPCSEPPLARSTFGVLDGAIEVAGHDDVEAGEVDHRVAVGVCSRDGDELHFLAVHVQRQLLAIGLLRQTDCRRRHAGLAVGLRVRDGPDGSAAPRAR